VRRPFLDTAIHCGPPRRPNEKSPGGREHRLSQQVFMKFRLEAILG
jgi:hypothetical protein